jgi:hypothetical protein
MPESEKPKPSDNAVPSEPTPFDKFKALASALVKVSPSELPQEPKKKEAKKRTNP